MNPEEQKLKHFDSFNNLKYTLPFGKFKDQSIVSVMKTEPRYLNWLYNKIETTPEAEKGKMLIEFSKFYKQISRNSILCPLGKYKGLPLIWIAQRDKEYISWLVNKCDYLKELDPVFYKAVMEIYGV